MTRLLLAQGEWFLDALEGTPYATKILGKGTLALYDSAIQSRILGTPGVTGIAAYVSQLSAQRVLTVSATIDTQFGQTSITQTL